MATSDDDTARVWFRRDLRDSDHAALHHALKSARRVYCAFVFDTDILDRLDDKADRRVKFIWERGLAIGRDYPRPIVDHAQQRERALAIYKNASNQTAAHGSDLN